jgi:hypothetical protein
MFDTWYGTGKDVKHALEGEPVSTKWLKHGIESAGYLFRMPAGQAAQSAQFLWDINDGEAQPENVAAFFHGIQYGKTKQ